jgi:hypothetical protein
MWAQTCWLISKTTKIEGENAEIMLRLAPYHLEKYIGWSLHKSLEYVKSRENMYRVNGILKSNSVGTQIYASIVDRVLDECIDIPIKTEQIFLDYITQHYGSQSIAGINIYTLIISGRGKPHHGNGLERYLKTLSKLLEFDESLVVIVLGDDKHEIQALRSRGGVISRILIPEDFNLDSKTVQFLSIRNSKLVFGDPSGIWAIFLLLGLKGFILDQIPTGELINRCFHVPRIWQDSMGNCASPDFYLKDSFLRLHSFTNNQGYWDHRLHTSEEIYSLFISNALSPNLSNSDEESLSIEDELVQFLLANNICQLRLR